MAPSGVSLEISEAGPYHLNLPSLKQPPPVFALAAIAVNEMLWGRPSVTSTRGAATTPSIFSLLAAAS